MSSINSEKLSEFPQNIRKINISLEKFIFEDISTIKISVKEAEEKLFSCIVIFFYDFSFYFNFFKIELQSKSRVFLFRNLYFL